MAVAFVLALGTKLQVGEQLWSLPGYWAWQLVPGFSNLRAPHRWLILVGLAAPVLAGVSLAWLQRLAAGRGRFALWIPKTVTST